MSPATPPAGDDEEIERFWKELGLGAPFVLRLRLLPDCLATPAGDDEEIERFWKELGLMEKGKVLVKGILG